MGGNLLAATTTLGATTVNGTALTVSGYLNVTGNVLGALGNFNTLSTRVTTGIAIANGGTNGSGDIGGTGATFNTVWAKATTAQYADVAERYLADDDYTPGTVVHFGGEQEVTLCDTDMCHRVAGVISTNPAHLMNEGLTGEHLADVALLGRVPCKVKGPVLKGDLMVSAGEGRARAENIPQMGSVIGKALEDFSGDYGVIEVVVGRI